MTEDQLLNNLGELARREEEAERARLDERWDRLSAGTLSPEEEAELQALAETSPAAREAYEAFRPLGAGFQVRVVDAIAAARAGETAGASPVVASPEPRSRLLPFRRAAARIEIWLGGAAAVAAALFFLLRAPLPALPVYTAELQGGAQAMRGGESEPANGLPVFFPGSLLTLSIHPQQPVKGPLEARAFREPAAGSGQIVPWQPAARFEIAGGHGRLRGTLGRDLQLPAGAWRIWLVVGRPGKLPSAAALAAELRAGRTRRDDWQAVSKDLRVDDRVPP